MANTDSSKATKLKMSESLKQLMMNKPLHKISIREITEHSQVNRQTFYYHFEDIYGLVKWTFQEVTLALLAEHDDNLFWQDGLLKLFDYLEENRSICLNLVNSIGQEDLNRLLYDQIYDLLHKVVLNLGKEFPNKEKHYLDFLTNFYSQAAYSLYISWLTGKISQTPEELIQMIDTTLQDQILGATIRMNRE